MPCWISQFLNVLMMLEAYLSILEPLVLHILQWFLQLSQRRFYTWGLQLITKLIWGRCWRASWKSRMDKHRWHGCCLPTHSCTPAKWNWIRVSFTALMAQGINAWGWCSLYWCAGLETGMIRPGRWAEPQAEVLPDSLAREGQAGVLMVLPPLAQQELAASAWAAAGPH